MQCIFRFPLSDLILDFQIVTHCSHGALGRVDSQRWRGMLDDSVSTHPSRYLPPARHRTS